MSYATILLSIILTCVVFHCAITGSEVNGLPIADSKSNKSDRVNEKTEMVKKVEDINLNKDDSSKKLEPKNEQKKGKDSGSGDEQKDNNGSNPKFKEGSKDGKLSQAREKCDSSSNSCTDDDKTLIACLRVPGNDSPDLSLLIQNEGKVPLRVTISAPDSVQLAKKEIQIPEKEYSEVKVSIRSAGSNDFIILTAGHGNCSLDIKDLNVKKNADITSQFSYINRATSIGFMFLAALAVLSVWMCITFWRKHSARGPKYQKLEMELPVSHGSKFESGSTEGWDDSWGDSWDDEEASKTPSLPVTPSLSSKGIASRRFGKEGWKD